MKKDLVPGMMCIVVAATDCPENIGRTVTLVKYLHAMELFKPPDGDERNKRSLSGGWLIEAPDLVVIIDNTKVVKSYSMARPEHLMPIDPDDIVLDIKEQEKEHEY